MTLSRRQFLGYTAAAPLILRYGLRADTSTVNERITCAVIGTGAMGRGQLRNALPRTQVLAVCDVDKTRREHYRDVANAFYTEHPDRGAPVCQAYEDYEDVMARDDIDVVIVETPDHWHTLITLAALQSGKDVYCDKPLTHYVDESVAVMQAVPALGRVLQTGSQQRSMRGFRVACELVRNGLIGKIERVNCAFGGPAGWHNLEPEPMEPGLNWNLWQGPAPERPYHSLLSPRGVHERLPAWRRFREYGGGGVMDWGTHTLDIAQWGLGRDDSGPVKAIPQSEPGARDAQLHYDDGVEIHQGGTEGVVHFFGSEGEVRVSRQTFRFVRDGEVLANFQSAEDGGSLQSTVALAERDFLRDAAVKLPAVRGHHMDDFLNSVRMRTRPVAHEQVGARSAICAQLVAMTYHYDQTLLWDPVNCRFRDGGGDPAWLVAPRRNFRAAL